MFDPLINLRQSGCRGYVLSNIVEGPGFPAILLTPHVKIFEDLSHSGLCYIVLHCRFV